MKYAAFWKRLTALVIDLIIMFIVFIILGSFIVDVLIMPSLHFEIEGGTTRIIMRDVLRFTIFIVFSWLYYSLMESSHYQGTLGKILLRIRVTDLNGDRLSLGRSTGRFLARIVSILTPFYIGFVAAAFTAKRQALHDIISKCLVIDGSNRLTG